MITLAKVDCIYKDGGTKRVEYIEDGETKICFIDYSIGSVSPGSIYQTFYGSKFYGELDQDKSTTIKSLLGSQ